MFRSGSGETHIKMKNDQREKAKNFFWGRYVVDVVVVVVERYALGSTLQLAPTLL